MISSIAFYLFTINGWGQSKVTLNIAAGLAKKGHSVSFYYSRLDNEIHIRKYKHLINFIKLETKTRFYSVFKLRNHIKDSSYDFFISAGNDNNCIVILAKFGTKTRTKFILTEHNSLSQVVTSSKRYFIGILPLFVRRLYKYSDAIVSVSYGIQNELEKIFEIKHPNKLVIYNPVVDHTITQLGNEDPGHRWLDGSYKVFLAAGRLSAQKDFEVLINAFNLISSNKHYRLIILGDGEDKNKLLSLINKLDIQNKVELYGRVDNPYAFMKRADVFVLSSRFEGLPTVLIEALECNLPIVSTNCPHGPSEILEDGKWGALVPVGNVEALAKEMQNAIQEPKKKNLRERADAFSYRKSIAEYEALLRNLTLK